MHSSSFYTIPPGRPFASDLAKGLLANMESPQELAQTQIFLPTRRAARALSAAFLQQSEGQALLLPKIRAIGDEEDYDTDLAHAFLSSDDGSLVPAIPEMRRLCLIARQVQLFPINNQLPTQAQSFALARALLQLLDQVQNAEFDIQNMQDLWPKELAAHWQDIAQFLSISWRYWPQILEAEGVMDPVARRIALMERQGQIWQERPPQTPIILAGSTGTLPATQKMMKIISTLPKGKVVFPGLVPDISDDDWQAIASDKVHPLHPLSITCQRLDISPSEVSIWPASDDYSPQLAARQQLLLEVMRPASQTDKWRDNKSMPKALQKAENLAGFRRMELQDDNQEAEVIALLMREALEVPNKTAILVTADRQLARMVQSELRRYDIDIDDSAGAPLLQSAVGGFLQLLANLLYSKDIFADLIALSAHPFSCGQTNRVTYRSFVDRVNKTYMRGPLRFDNLQGLCDAIKDDKAVHDFMLNHIMAPLEALLSLAEEQDISLSKFASILGEVAENFASSESEELSDIVTKLWSGADGEAAANLLQQMAQYGGDYLITPQAFRDILEEFLRTTEVRRPFQKQSRLSILGAVESRMVSADLIILSGLNEGVWPPKAGQDLWMNQAMAKAIGLPHRQWRIALSAHDFLMAATMPDVVITRSRRQNDTVALPSRWLTRLDAVMTAFKISDLVAPKIPDDIQDILHWRKQISHTPISPPKPCPPIALRPTKFTATEFDNLISDPYAIYAKKILGLRALSPIGERPNAALKGTIFHKALHLFTQKHPRGEVGLAQLDELLDIAKPLFDEWLIHYEVIHFWWPQFMAVAKWFLQADNTLRQVNDISFSEQKGEITLHVGKREFTIVAKADRIVLHDDNTASVIDYKTGVVPSKTALTKGRATQMLVETALLLEGGYPMIGDSLDVSSLEYWKLSGRGQASGEIKNVTPKDYAPHDLFSVITHLIARFEDENMPYYSEPDPRGRQAYSDYRHLARIKEWRVLEVTNDE